jgi:hypothetical protein
MGPKKLKLGGIYEDKDGYLFQIIKQTLSHDGIMLYVATPKGPHMQPNLLYLEDGGCIDGRYEHELIIYK